MSKIQYINNSAKYRQIVSSPDDKHCASEGPVSSSVLYLQSSFMLVLRLTCYQAIFSLNSGDSQDASSSDKKLAQY